MPHLTALFVASFAPSLALLGYYALRVRGLHVPLKLLLGVFAGGLVAGPLAMGAFELLAEHQFYALLEHMDQAREPEIFAYTLFAIGPIEELAKFSVVLLTVYRFGRVERPAVGVVYAAAAALGFATFENWQAMVVLDEPLWYRAFTLPFVHVLFSSFWGYALGSERQAIAGIPARVPYVSTGLILSFVYHGVYDYILLSEWLPHYLVLPLVLILWLWIQAALGRSTREERIVQRQRQE